MNFYSSKNSRLAIQQKILPQKILGIGLLCSLLALSSCGGSSSTTALKNELPSPVAEGIKDNALQPAPAGKEPVPQTELGSLPTITVNQRQFADPNVLLNLNATVTAAAGASIVTTLWTQVTGPAVRIPSPLQINNEIIIPDVAVATTLEFRLTAQDSKGKINSATVSILVKPVASFIKVSGGVFDEAATAAVFTLRLNAASNVPVTVSYTTQDGSAINGNDYTLTSGQIIFAAGEVSKTVSVPLLKDTLTEGDETFSLQVSTTQAGITYNSSGTAIIHNSNSVLLPQTVNFSSAQPATIKVAGTYTNPLIAGAGVGTVLYTSSNPQVATVDANGLVTALTPGTATITATKAGDSLYEAAQAIYEVTVSGNSSSASSVPIGSAPTGSAPIVKIDGYSESMITSPDIINYTNTFSQLYIYAKAQDAEDGVISPTATTPTSSLVWTSDIDGILGYGSPLIYDKLSQGTHKITVSATDSNGNTGSDSIIVFGGNLGGDRATVQDEKITPPCSTNIENIHDGKLSTSYNAGCQGKGVTYVFWTFPVVINALELYTTPEDPIALYTIEYLDMSSGQWKLLVQDSGNRAATDLHHSYPIASIVTTNLRITQPKSGSISEFVIFGRFVNDAGSRVKFIKPEPASIRVFEQYSNTLAKDYFGDVDYTSSNPLVASVDKFGTVTALTEGSTTISAVATQRSIYLPATANYELQVQPASSKTLSVIRYTWGRLVESISLLPGGELPLIGSASKDGKEIDIGNITSWTSNIDGFLSNSPLLGKVTLSQGTHTLNLSMGSDANNPGIASVTVFSGNLSASASIHDMRKPNCHFGNPDSIIDSNLRTSYDPGCRGEGWIYLNWGAPVNIDSIEVYTDASAPVENYKIEYLDAATGLWKLLVQDPGNRAATDLHHIYPAAKTTTRELRLVQPKSGLINELIIFGASTWKP